MPVSAVWDKASYVAGEMMTATVSGQLAVDTPTTTTETVGPVTIPVVSNGGVQSTVTVPVVTVSRTTITTVLQDVLIDTTRPIVGGGSRTWTVTADKRQIKATA